MKSLITTLFLLAALAACTSTGGNQVANTLASQDTAGQAADTPASAENQTALAPEPGPTPAEQATQAQAGENIELASINPEKAVTFVAVEGAPQGKVSTLSGAMRGAAQTHGLNLLPPSVGASAPYQIKGYFSALNDGSGTLLVYIWDVQDKSGKMLHRINGQERSGTIKTDPWQAITETELRRVADNTAARLKSWVDTRN